MNKIESDFVEMQNRVKLMSKKGSNKKTDHENIVNVMFKNLSKIWWLPDDILTYSQGEHISTEVHARISELGKDKNLMESRQVGRFKARRLRTENFIGGFPIIDFTLVSTKYSTNNMNKRDNESLN